MKTKVIKILCFAFIAIFLSACNSRISKANFDKIQTSMNFQEVVAILGSPSSTASLSFGNTTAMSARWQNRNGTITLQFFNGLVKVKEFVQGVTTPHENYAP